MNELSRTSSLEVQRQTKPVWERAGDRSEARSHRTSVDKAIAAHRERVHARRSRVQNNLLAAMDISSKFFPKQQAGQAPENKAVATQPAQNDAVATDNLRANINALMPGNPDENIKDYLVEDFTETNVPNEVVEDVDVPKGTYIDYQA